VYVELSNKDLIIVSNFAASYSAENTGIELMFSSLALIELKRFFVELNKTSSIALLLSCLVSNVN
jgi:hypothetical protein